MIAQYYVVMVLIATNLICGYNCGPGEKMLLKKFFDPSTAKDHNILERPVKNDSDPLQLNMDIALINIIKLDVLKSQLHFNVWMSLKWKDYNFQWNPKEFDGVTSLHIPTNKIWIPDIRLYNSIDDKMIDQYNTDAIVSNTGDITWVPPRQYKSPCFANLENEFPFGIQRCVLKFGSWTYSSNLLNLTSNRNVNLEDYQANNEFHIVESKGVRQDLRYACCVETYTNYEFTLAIRRETSYYYVNYFFPCFILAMMTLIMFILPPATSEKIIIGTITLVSLIGLQLIVAQTFPAGWVRLPKISQYIMWIMILCLLSTLCSAFILHLHHRSDTGVRLPNWIKICITKHLATVLFMKMEDTSIPMEDFSLNKSTSAKDTRTENLTIIAEELKEITKRMYGDTLGKECKFAARVVDRACLVSFGLVTFIFTLNFFIQR